MQRPTFGSPGRLRAGAAALALVCLAATACSDDDEPDATATTGTTAATSAAAATSAGTSAGATSAETSAAGAAPASAATSAAAAAGGDEKAELTMVVQPFAMDNFTKVVNAYKTVKPNVKITLTAGPAASAEYIQSLATQRIGGQLPDLFESFDVISNEMATEGLTEDLVPWLDKSQTLKRDTFADAFLASYIPRKSPNELHGVPVAADATVVFYNKRIFNEAKVPLPTDDWTYEQFLDAAKKISEAGKGKYWGVSLQNDGAVPPSIWQAQYQPMIRAFGGKVYDEATNTVGIGSPEAVKAWELLLAPLKNGGTAPYGTSAGASAPTFAGGKYGMQISVRAQMPSYMEPLKADGWDVVQMPTVNGKHPVGGGSYGIAMSKETKKKDAAFAFIEWFYSNDGGIKLLEDTYATVPPTKTGIEGGTWKTLPAPPENHEAFGAAISDAIIAPAMPGKSGSALDEAILTAVQEVALKNVPIADAFKKAEESVNKALEAEK